MGGQEWKKALKVLEKFSLHSLRLLCRPLEGGTTEVKFSPKRNRKLDVGLITNQIRYFLLVVFEHASVNVGTSKALFQISDVVWTERTRFKRTPHEGSNV
jgi:hypothetical protein